VAAVAAVGHLLEILILLTMGHGQVKVLDLIPVMGKSLGHHGLGPLLVKLDMTTFAGLGLLELLIGNGTLRLLSRRPVLAMHR
jgi:hypothetical protein